MIYEFETSMHVCDTEHVDRNIEKADQFLLSKIALGDF